MPTERLLISAPRLLDVVEGSWAEDRTILVTDGRIEAVLGPGDATPDGARRLDPPGGWLIPGLIDCHTHLVGNMEFSGVAGSVTSASEEAMFGVRNAALTLRAGFTTVRDVGTFRAFVDVALRDAIDAGWLPGPRMQCAGAYVTSPRGGGEVTGLARDFVVPDDLRFAVVRTIGDVRERVRALVGGGADLIKCIATGAVLARGTRVNSVELDEPLLRAAVEEADRQGVFVAAHAHGTEGIKTAIRAGVRSIEHGSLIDDEGIQLLVRHGTWLVADVYDGDWIAQEGERAGWPAEIMAKNKATTEAQRLGFSKAVAAGARLAFGTDSGVYPHGMNAIQFGYQVRLGRSPLDAIRSATIGAAELMGWDHLVGSLRPGRFADLVAVASDPLGDVEVLRGPAAVMKGGALVSPDGE